MIYYSGKKASCFKWCLLMFIAVIGQSYQCFSQQLVVREDTLVQKFYKHQPDSLFWFSNSESLKKATDWLLVIESAAPLGIDLNQLQTGQIHQALLSNNGLDGISKIQRDRQITGFVLNFLKKLQEGDIHFDYDEVSVCRDSFYIDQLLNFKSHESVSAIVSRLDCKDREYLVLKQFKNDSIPATDSLRHRKIALAMNYRRYFSTNPQPERIVVNIPATEMSYYQRDFLKVKMKTVVGKKLSQTPTIASFVTSIQTFPNWNVPHKIGVQEILPHVKKSANYLEQHNYDVVNSKGVVIDESTLNWKSYNEKNFPYYFRQAKGSRNSLGTIKFDLDNPFSIFLHATSWQGAFAQNYRFLSHGCIRLEKPYLLADNLLRSEKNIEKLKNSRKTKQAKTIILLQKVPVFIVYNPVVVEGNRVIFLADTYELLK